MTSSRGPADRSLQDYARPGGARECSPFLSSASRLRLVDLEGLPYPIAGPDGPRRMALTREIFGEQDVIRIGNEFLTARRHDLRGPAHRHDQAPMRRVSETNRDVWRFEYVTAKHD